MAVQSVAAAPQDEPSDWVIEPAAGMSGWVRPLVTRLRDELASARGHWSLAIADPRTGEAAYWRANEPMLAASLYKTGVLVEVYARLTDGRLQPDASVVLREIDVDPDWGGSSYAAGTELALAPALWSMIALSDNGTAHALLHQVGGAATLNARFGALGMPGTRFVDDDVYTTARDQAHVYAALARGEVVSREASLAMLRLLKGQRVNDRLPSDLPAGEDWVFAHKTGNSGTAAADAGLLTTPGGAAAISVLVEDYDDYADAERTFGRIGALVYQGLGGAQPWPDRAAPSLYEQLVAPSVDFPMLMRAG